MDHEPPTTPAAASLPTYAINHVEGQAVIIGPNARQQIDHYGDIIVRVDSLEELPPKPGEPPYKGLTYYTEADAAIFFGREHLSDDLAARLETTAFLAVAGASGSGKSSLLRAGVIPRLRRRNWLIHLLTPTADPLTQLANSLTQDDADLAAADTLRAALAADSQTLRRAAEKRLARSDAARLLLIVDQFEELFTQRQDKIQDEIGRRAFIDNLLAAARDAGRTTVLIGLRADFTGRLTEVEELRARVEQNFALLGPMQQEDLVRVIAEPARVGGWAFVSGLVEQILSDVGQEPGQLPLLSHALLETWQRRAGHVMTLRGYLAAGGVEKAIATTAEDTLRRLDKDGQAIAQSIFLALTKLGEGSADTRRLARREELARAGDPAAVDAVLNTLAAARLVTVDADTVQVAHEALIRHWPRLREWLDDNRERIRFERQLEADAAEWEELKYEEDVLYRGTPLIQAQTRKAGHRLSPLAEKFLAASAVEAANEAREAKELERAGLVQRFAIALSVLLVIAVALAVVAWRTQGEVERLNRQILSRRLATEGENALARDPEEALLLAAAGYQTTHLSDGATTDEARIALYHALDTPFRMTLAGHGDEVTSAVFSLDGTRVVTASDDGTARLWDATNGAPLATLEGHGDVVNSAAFSRDGTRVVTASRDGTARLWDAVSGETLAMLEGHGSEVWSAAFSRDGTRVVTAGGDGTARLWNAVNGSQLEALEGHNGAVWFAAFSPDGTRVVTVDGMARVWNARSGELLEVLEGHNGNVWSAAFSPDGTQVVTASEDWTARVWNASSGELSEILEGHGEQVNSAVFSRDGMLLVTGSDDRTARIWDAASGELMEVLEGHDGPVTSVAFSPDGTRVVTGSFDGTARLWDAASGELVEVLEGHNEWVTSVAFSPDGTRVVTGSNDGTARLWDATNSAVLEGHNGPVWSAAFSPDGTRVVTVDGTARVWDTGSGKLLEVLEGHDEEVNSAVFSRDGMLLVTGSYDKTARIWDAVSGEPKEVLEGHDGLVTSVAFSPDGTRAVTGSLDSTAWLWDAASGEPMKPLEGHDGEVYSVGFSPDGTRVVTVGVTTAWLWDAVTGELLAVLDGHQGALNSAFFSPDGKWVLTASNDRTARLWDAASGEPLAALTGHEGEVTSAVFSPDGTQVVTASGDNTARLWDAASGAELEVLARHEAPVISVAFSPDGMRVLTASSDETARLWDAATGEPLAVLAEHEAVVWSAAFSPDGTRVVTASLDGTARLWAIPPADMIAEAHRRLRREPNDVIFNFCNLYFQDAPNDCPDTLAKLFPEGD